MSVGELRFSRTTGYNASQAKCYTEVFPQYASQDAKGGWKGPGGKAAKAYKDVLFSKCGISR